QRGEGARAHQVRQEVRAEGSARDPGRSAPRQGQEEGRPPGRDPGGPGRGLRDPAPVHELPAVAQTPCSAISARRLIRAAVGGWVENRLPNWTRRPASGLTMNRCASAGPTVAGAGTFFE